MWHTWFDRRLPAGPILERSNLSMRIREYGTSGPLLIVIHGGPAVAGYMAPVARELEGSFRVIEPFQRPSGAAPLTVATHVDDLRDLVVCHGSDPPPALIGHSWGAMLALAFAAAHPDLAGPLVLIGCGTFDPLSRDCMRKNRSQRMTDSSRDRLARLSDEIADPDRRLAAMGDLFLSLDSCDLLPAAHEPVECDAGAHEETWADMLRLQEEGLYPAAFAAIRSPVLMLHGAGDPHPGRMILESLLFHIPQIEYREWERCGHYPWLERAVRDEFFATLKAWLRKHATAAPAA